MLVLRLLLLLHDGSPELVAVDELEQHLLGHRVLDALHHSCNCIHMISEIYSEEHTSIIFRLSSNPVSGFSMMEQVRLCAIWPMETWLGSWLFHEPHTGLDHCLNMLLACSSAGLEKSGQQSKISRRCWAVLTSLSVFLSGLWASPLLLFSTKKTGLKKRDMKCWVVAMCNGGARSYSAVPIFLTLLLRIDLCMNMIYSAIHPVCHNVVAKSCEGLLGQ